MLDLVLTDEMVIYVKVEMVELDEADIVVLDDEETVEIHIFEPEEQDTLEVILEHDELVDSLYVVAEVIDELEDELLTGMVELEGLVDSEL